MKEEMVYKEFRVVIEDGNNLRIIKPSGMSRRANMQMDPLKKRTIKVFSKWLANGAIKEREDLSVLGSHLYTGLFNSDIGKEFKEEFDRVQEQPSIILRLVLEFEQEARELAEMPLEYVYYPDTDKEKGFFLATRSRLILARHVPLIIRDIRPSPKPLRILIVISSPELDTDGKSLLIVNAEPVINTIEELEKRLPNSIETHKLLQPTKLSLAEKVKQLQPHVLHFIGHGQYRRGEGYLALVKDDLKTARWVNEMDLADCFLDYQPRLIFLHACQGAHAESYKAFMGIALKLARQKVSAVMAMQYEVTNEVANIFANRFYKSLGEGKPIDAAVQDGRLELSMYLEEENFSSRAFGSPVVYLQSAENIIIPSHRCPSCGAEAHENDRFCGECGKSMRS